MPACARASSSAVRSRAASAARLSELSDLLCQARLVLARECELLLEPRHFGIRSIEGALLVVQRIARGEMLVA
jgi:hypothetical protein